MRSSKYSQTQITGNVEIQITEKNRTDLLNLAYPHNHIIASLIKDTRYDKITVDASSAVAVASSSLEVDYERSNFQINKIVYKTLKTTLKNRNIARKLVEYQHQQHNGKK